MPITGSATLYARVRRHFDWSKTKEFDTLHSKKCMCCQTTCAEQLGEWATTILYSGLLRWSSCHLCTSYRPRGKLYRKLLYAFSYNSLKRNSKKSQLNPKNNPKIVPIPYFFRIGLPLNICIGSLSLENYKLDVEYT